MVDDLCILKPISVLHVDDDRSFLEIVKVILEMESDLRVTTTSSADEALNLLSQGCFDIILSDCRMVRMDGVRFLEKVRVLDPTIPFIFFTGREKKDVFTGVLDGSIMYLRKGGDPAVQYAELADLIRTNVLQRGTR